MDNLYEQVINDILKGTTEFRIVEKFKTTDVSEEQVRGIIAEFKLFTDTVGAVLKSRRYGYSYEQIEKSFRQASKDEEFIVGVINMAKQMEQETQIESGDIDKEVSTWSQIGNATLTALSMSGGGEGPDQARLFGEPGSNEVINQILMLPRLRSYSKFLIFFSIAVALLFTWIYLTGEEDGDQYTIYVAAVGYVGIVTSFLLRRLTKPKGTKPRA